jgi:hypothetical protein
MHYAHKSIDTERKHRGKLRLRPLFSCEFYTGQPQSCSDVNSQALFQTNIKEIMVRKTRVTTAGRDGVTVRKG